MSYKKAQLREAEDKIDEEQTRLAKIRNQNKVDLLFEAFWRQRQMELYPKEFQINTGIPTPQEVLITQQKNDNNDGTNRVTAISNLASISDQEIANYIVDRLAPPEVSALLQSFDKLKRELKKNYPKGLSKDEFVQFIKLKVAKPDYNIANVIEQPLYEP